MRWDILIVVGSELIAALAWIYHYRRLRERRFKFLAIYLCIIVGIEIVNLLLQSAFTAGMVDYFNIPLGLIFFICFLLPGPPKRERLIAAVFIALYMACFIAERLHLLLPPVNFDSLSYGVGNLLLIVALVMAIIKIFRGKDLEAHDQRMLFRVILGLMIFYIGSFPYENFRNYLWSNRSYWPTAWVMHYTSQVFACLMYLMFAYALRWKNNS
jgi:hypothetical protein